METNQQGDMFSLFRQAATAMSAGILLILTGTTQQLNIIGLAFSVISFIILFAAFFRLFEKYRKFSDFVFKISDELTILFIVISLYSIIRNWAAITNAINAANNATVHGISWAQSASYWIVIVWFLLFAIAFIATALFFIMRVAKKNMEKLGARGLFIILAAVLYTLGCAGIAKFVNGTLNLAFFILSLLVTLVSGAYIIWQKNKNKSVIENDKNINKS